MNVSELSSLTVIELEKEYSTILDYFLNFGIQFPDKQQTLEHRLSEMSRTEFDDLGISRSQLLQNLESYLQLQYQSSENELLVSSICIEGGKNKYGENENILVRLERGSITAIVGPTGSGKSRLLADIEWMAQNDTPTGRIILINDQLPDISLRFSIENKLVAQLSQNMNFVMDATVSEFLHLHAESRGVENVSEMVDQILNQANELAGESFSLDTPLTSLSGGQSRALMIADTALLSKSPVVLIDEIENAGIDRKKALSLLVKNEKIILMATHDPILALMADQRLVIKNGGISQLIVTTYEEKENLSMLEMLDNQLMVMRNALRNGKIIDFIENN